MAWRLPERPDVECVPVSMAIASDTPSDGGWAWYFSFREQRLVDGKILPWDWNCGRFRCVMRSFMLGDMPYGTGPSLLWFCERINANKCSEYDWIGADYWTGGEFIFEFWPVSEGLVQVHTEADHDGDFNFCLHLLMSASDVMRCFNKLNWMLESCRMFRRHYGLL